MVDCQGCKDSTATNYDANATADDGSLLHMYACSSVKRESFNGVAHSFQRAHSLSMCPRINFLGSLHFSSSFIRLVPFEYENSTRARTQAQIEGCTFRRNYNSSATTDDGSCNYDPHSLIPDFSGAFGGFAVDGNTFTFPSGAEDWGGVANDNANIYPLMFQERMTLSSLLLLFLQVVTLRSNSIQWKPYPDVEPSYNTDQ